MFFRGQTIEIFFRFLWVGLVFGLISIIFRLVNKLSNRNVFIVNITGFVYWIGFGLCFNVLCMRLYNFTFCWFGLIGMIIGLCFIKFSIQFFFDYFIRFIYNEFSLLKRKRRNGKLQTDKKV